MAAPEITLQAPLVMIQNGETSTLGGVATGTALNFGTIVNIYETSDFYSVGDNVMYNTNGQTLVKYDNVEYAIVEENKIYYKEPPAT